MSWLWVDNRPVDLFVPIWHCSSPAYDTLTNCGALTSSLWGDYYDRVTLTDTYCETQMFFICERNVHYKGYNPVEEEEEEKRLLESEDNGSLLGDLEEDNFAAFKEGEDYVI